MKTTLSSIALFVLSLGAIVCSGQTATVPAPTPYSVVHREINERTWQRTKYIPSPNGKMISEIESYREVGNCICFHGQNGWEDSRDDISILPDGSGASTNAPCKVLIPPDIYEGVIRLTTASGLELQFEPIGIWCSDNAAAVQVAYLTNSVGELINSNQVLYPDAFAGGLTGDLLLTFRNSGLEQDAIIHSQPTASPEQLGLNSSETKLQLITEFINSPTPVQSAGPVNPQDGLQDTTLTFGSLKMIQGHAFQTGSSNAPSLQSRIRVYKTWTTTSDGRSLLIEQVPYQRVSAELSALPRGASRSTRSGSSLLGRASSGYTLPPHRSFTTAKKSGRLRRGAFTAQPGLDLDFVTLDSPETNMVFAADTTFLINTSGMGLYLYGTNTIEGGTVIKLQNGFGNYGELILDQNGVINCDTAPYRPGLFTSIDDNSVGSTVSGSSGSPVYQSVLWCLQINGTNADFHDLRFSYAWIGIGQDNNAGQQTTIGVTNCQFIGGDIAVYAYNASLYNVLIGRSVNNDAAVWTEGPSLIGENITADGGNCFAEADDAGASVALTNCLITGQPLLASGGSPVLSTNAVAWLPSPSTPVYQTVGGSSYYLTNGCPYRNAGTTNIDPNLLADLTQRTTWPPVVYDGTNISSLGTLGPAVPRDLSSAPDLGYHHDCLDWVFAACTLSGSLTFTPGTAVGWFEDGSGPYGQPYGICLNGGSSISFNGTATQPCIFARYPMVQEAENGNWNGDGWMGALVFNGGSPEPVLSANFTKFTSDFWNGNVFRDAWASGAGSFKNCEFYSFNISTYDVTSLIFTNCLFYRFNQSCWTSPNVTFENCTFYNGGIYLGRSSPVTWSIENCSFDGTAFDWSDSYHGTAYTTINYNAYNTNNLSWQTDPYISPQYGTNEVVGPNDLMVTNFDWIAGEFGNFYLPWDSPLIDQGSTYANLLGLYHFTTQTNQVPDGTNTVTIGYHYVATDQYGNPLDSNGDGIPDYLEDPAGNGSGDWDTTMYLNVIITQPRNGSIVP